MTAGLNAQPRDCSVNVYVLTDVATPGASILLYGAKLKAVAMFREIGVNIRMRDGIPAGVPSDTCGAPIMVLLENANYYPGSAEALAYATPYKESGTRIHVFLDRVLLNRKPTLANALLAHVMVHEITHVLEQVKRHSEEGVMRAHWSHEDYRRMERNPHHFGGRTTTSIPGRSPYSGPSFR
jgi:hypothetical protein